MTTWTKRIWTTALSLCIGGAAASTAQGQSYPAYPQPTYPAYPQPTRSAVAMPQQQWTISAADPKAPPADLPPGKAPTTPQAPTPPIAPADQAASTAPTTPDASADTSSLDVGGVATASALGMQGRADSNNRFNLFDNMAAIPTSRIWAGYQYVNKFNTNVSSGDFVLQKQDQTNLYRQGVEIAIGSNFSIAVQDEYIGTTGSDPSSWGNPQFMAKYAFVNNECTTVSAILGFQPQVSTSTNELHERTTRFYPGMLFYRTMGDKLFVQGGGQFGVSTSDAPQTIDYALSFGYWLYRDQRLEANGRASKSACDSCEHGWIAGLIPQIEIFGTNVIGNAHGQALDVSNVGGTAFSEGRNVYDVTLGGRVLFTPRVSLGSGFSFPISGSQTRSAEFTSTLNISF